MLVMIWTELAPNRQVDVRQSTQVSPETSQDNGVMLIHAKPSADAHARRGDRYPRGSDLTKMHDCRLQQSAMPLLTELMFGSLSGQASMRAAMHRAEGNRRPAPLAPMTAIRLKAAAEADELAPAR
jgi:hypothetical protein